MFFRPNTLDGAAAAFTRDFQRCVVDPYEAEKAEDNGSVYYV